MRKLLRIHQENGCTGEYRTRTEEYFLAYLINAVRQKNWWSF